MRKEPNFASSLSLSLYFFVVRISRIHTYPVECIDDWSLVEESSEKEREDLKKKGERREKERERKRGKKRLLAARVPRRRRAVISLLFEARGRDTLCICLKGKFPPREIR